MAAGSALWFQLNRHLEETVFVCVVFDTRPVGIRQVGLAIGRVNAPCRLVWWKFRHPGDNRLAGHPVNVYHGDVDKNAAGLNVSPLDYYKGIPNYEKNKFTPNPSQQN